jgi:hypothetical protein
MKKSVFGLVVAALVAAGCGSEETPKEDKSLRDSMEGKNFDPNKMPPEARAVIEGMRNSGGKPPANK